MKTKTTYRVNMERLINSIYIFITLIFAAIIGIASIWLKLMSYDMVLGMTIIWGVCTVIAFGLMILVSINKRK